MNNSLKFYPGTSVTVGGGGAGAFAKTVATGALTGGTEISVAHNMGYSNYTFSVADADNLVGVSTLKVDPAFPTTNFLIEVAADIPGGLNVTCIGW